MTSRRSGLDNCRDSLRFLGAPKPTCDLIQQGSSVDGIDTRNLDDEALDEFLSCLIFQLGGKEAEPPSRKGAKRCLVERAKKPSSSSVVEKRGAKTRNPRKGFTRGLSQPSFCCVQFSTVEIREYVVELGDNPECTSGPAITFGWKYFTVLRRSVSEFEANRPARREPDELYLPRSLRENILRENGFSHAEIAEAVRIKARDRVRRLNTVLNWKYNRYEETMESARRKVMRFFKLKKKDNELIEELWAEAAARYGHDSEPSKNTVQKRKSVTNPCA